MKWSFLIVLAPAVLTGCGTTVGGTTAPSTDEVEITAGQVMLGTSDEAQLDSPSKMAQVNTFKIDKTEVTNAQFRACVKAGACTDPAQDGIDVIPDYYTNADYDAYPVAFVSWYQAQDYCASLGKRLPTEAEWETAARGADGKTYPWGEGQPDCTLAHFGECMNTGMNISSPLAVGSLPGGASQYGVLDMSGNMAEWVVDWYDSESYRMWNDGETPSSPAGGRMKSIRGGSWWCKIDRLPTFRREPMSPFYRAGNIGFRCAR